MSKRFTDTDKYKKPFIRGLQGAYKLLWDYIYHDCNHAGIWIVDFEIAQIYLGADMPVNKKDALKYFNADEERIIEIDDGKKWFIPSFISFQYGILSQNNRAHSSVLQILEKYNIKPLTSPLQGAKDKDMDIVLNTNTNTEENTKYILREKPSSQNENLQPVIDKFIELTDKPPDRVIYKFIKSIINGAAKNPKTFESLSIRSIAEVVKASHIMIHSKYGINAISFCYALEVLDGKTKGNEILTPKLKKATYD